MYSSTLFFTVCAFFSVASLAVNVSTPWDYQVLCQRFPPAFSGNDTFNPAAITALSKAISDNSYNPKLPLEGVTLRGGYSSRIGWAGSGGFQVCVQNWYFFNTVTVRLEDISKGVAAMGDACCDIDEFRAQPGRSKVPGSGGRKGLCQDAKATVQAVDGRTATLVAQDYGELCCGMWGC